MTRSIAVVSGKGGSGKTMIVATIAEILEAHNRKTVLVDTDVGTGGLSYYLSIKYSRGIGLGLSEMLLAELDKGTESSPVAVSTPGLPAQTVRPLRGFSNTRFVSVGDLRKLQNQVSSEFSSGTVFANKINRCLEIIKTNTLDASIMLVDCRGGIDPESIEVCKFVDDIVIIAETDPASFQATQNLANVLSDNNLSHKIKGFIVNRAFDDPGGIVRTGIQAFRGEFLGAIPFDLEAIRKFHVGELPERTTIFYTHVWHAVSQAYPDLISEPAGRIWDFREYRSVDFGDVYSAAGGGVLAVAILVCLVFGIAFFDHRLFLDFVFQNKGLDWLLAGLILGLVGSLGGVRRALGRFLTIYLMTGARILTAVFASPFRLKTSDTPDTLPQP